MHDEFVLGLEDCDETQAPRIGGKGLGLGALTALGHVVPRGFVVTTDGFRTSVAADGLLDEISGWTSDLTQSTDNSEVSARIEKEIVHRGMADEVRVAVLGAYAALGDDVPVAIRSSATAEDTEDASFAGQQDTYLWVRGADSVVEHVVRCWASLFTAQAIGYRHLVGVEPEDVQMAVVVQTMVDAAAAGVMMTLHPVTGDRSTVYVESALGLGEAVVRGEVETDRFELDKETLDERARVIGHQSFAYRLDPTSGTVERFDTGADGDAPTLSAEEVHRLGELGAQLEQQFGRPMDIEWAIDGRRQIQLLQARPETVWSRRPTRDQVERAIADSGSGEPLHSHSEPVHYWATSNMGEAMPGVQTPLSWTVWADGVEKAPREAAYQVGALPRAQRHVPADPDDRCLRIFYGRPAMSVDFMADLGNRLPGTTGQATVSSLLGRAPEDLDYTSTKRRYPIVAWRLPYTFARTPGRITAFAAQQDDWYRRIIPQVADADEARLREILRDAHRRHIESLAVQTTGIFGVIQPVHELMAKVVADLEPELASVLTGPPGGAEMAVVADIWAASRGRLGIEELIARHGFHGPIEGELISRVWREEPAPLLGLVESYRDRGDEHDPALLDERRRAAHRTAEAAVLAKASWPARQGLRLVLRLGRTRLPLRGVTKRSFLQAFDTIRTASRRLGDLWVAEGRLDDADDIFFLTLDEVLAGAPADARQLVADRRARRAAYQEFDVPPAWQGLPEIDLSGPAACTAGAEDGDLVGIGVSAGVVEGRARVLLTPDFGAVQPDEILVAPTTDPSWSSIMFVSAGLVVDIGGALSHAAVVAREMGLPCIVNTHSGTKQLRTGDLIRIDGGSGVVTILERA